MSEFYRLRRHSIADVTAFFGFLVGFLGSGPIAWPFLQVGFQTGEIVKGFTYFIAIICGSGVLCGAIGLALGTAGGWVWEHGHRFLRHDPPAPVAGRRRASTGHVVRRADTAPTVPGIRFETADPDPRAYAALLQRAAGEGHDVSTLERALRRTTNVVAWDGRRLVGIIRVLTDGHRYAHLVELMVDAAHRRRGIGRELVRRAAREVPVPMVIGAVPAESMPFFARLGLPVESGAGTVKHGDTTGRSLSAE